MTTHSTRGLLIATWAFAGLVIGTAEAAPARKPNIVVIWGDDVGFTNLSVYSRGVMGYRTPNIDRIAREGAAYVFNVRQDPYESYDQAPGPRATITQQKTWLYNDVMDRLGRHMGTLQKYPPRQNGTSLSIAN
jgi:hypothetical protein